MSLLRLLNLRYLEPALHSLLEQFIWIVFLCRLSQKSHIALTVTAQRILARICIVHIDPIYSDVNFLRILPEVIFEILCRLQQERFVLWGLGCHGVQPEESVRGDLVEPENVPALPVGCFGEVPRERLEETLGYELLGRHGHFQLF